MTDSLADRLRAKREKEPDADLDVDGVDAADGESDGDTGLAARLKQLKMRDAGASDPESIQRAVQSKASLADRLRGGARPLQTSEAAAVDESDDRPSWLDGPEQDDEEVSTFAERLRRLQEAPPARQVELDEKTSKSRVLEWLLGQDAQNVGSGPVTPLPPIPKGMKEIDFYEVDPPFAFVRILENPRTGEYTYQAIEPPLSDRDRDVLLFVQEALVRGLNEDPGGLEANEREEYLGRAVRQVLHDYRIRIDTVSQERIEYFVRRDFLGLGTIHVVMKDPGIEDISCDGPEETLFVFHRDYEQIPTNIAFEDDADLDGFVIRMAQRAGKAVSISDPILDAALPDGSRLQATLGREVTENGSTFTIRRFKPDPFTPVDLLRFGTMSVDLLAWFWLIVQNGHSLIFSGGTASGKTTALNAISQFIPHSAKLVTIEDTREVNLPHKNWIKGVTRHGSASDGGAGEIGMFELLKAALRQRPDYILVGEVRGIEATVAFQAMATGHTVYSTMHADSARSVVYRLENDPINIPRLVLQALDVIAIQAQVRYQGKRTRRVREVVELVGMDPSTRELLTNQVFHWNPRNDEFEYSGRSYLLEHIANEKNWSPDEMAAEFERRKHVLKMLVKNDIRTVEQLTKLVRAYYRDQDKVIQQLEEASGRKG